jgi:hypothetical protein
MMYVVTKETVTKIDVQAETRNCAFFFGEEERLTGGNWLSAGFNPLGIFLFLKRGGILE